MGSFCYTQVIANETSAFRTSEMLNDVRPGHIAVGPSREVAATFLRALDLGSELVDRVEIFAVVDPDGLGPLEFPNPNDTPNPFCPPLAPAGMGCIYPVAVTNLDYFERLVATGQVPISPLANLAWDRSADRLYLVTTSEVFQDSYETDIELYYTEDAVGGVWSGPIRVNQDPEPATMVDMMGATVPVPEEVRSQFLPHIEVEQATGDVIVAWYDPRNDDGSGASGGQGGTDGVRNNEYQVFVARGQWNGQGLTFTDEAVSGEIDAGAAGCLPAFSRASNQATPTDYLGVGIDGDGEAIAVWADNSNSLGDNGSNDCDDRPCMDILPEPSGLWAQLAALGALLWLGASRRARH